MAVFPTREEPRGSHMTKQILHRKGFTLVELPAVSKRAFTLVELLVVIGIIVVLMGILLPVASRAQESARRVKCASNLRQMGQAILAYSSANDGKFPRAYFDNAAATR